jgi:hypothetical protein
MSRFLTPLFVLLLAAPAVLAQTDEFEKVLLPISTPETAGANGSIWVTEHYARNNGSTIVRTLRDDCAEAVCEVFLQPQTTVRLSPARKRNMTWVSVERGRADQLSFSTVVRDTSRLIEPWGTEMPAVREHEFHSEAVQLLNVPNDPVFRLYLRIYALVEPGPPHELQVIVRAYDLNAETGGAPTHQPIGEHTYTMRDSQFAQGLDYLEVQDIRKDLNLGGQTRLRIEIQRLGGSPARLWALLSATNNVTQHVSIITPQ